MLFIVILLLALEYLGFAPDTNFWIAVVSVIVGAVLALTGWSGPLIVINKKQA